MSSLDWYVVLGLIAVAGLVLIPVVMIGRIVVGILIAAREARIAEARRVTHVVPGLGPFSSTDGELWWGEVAGLHVCILSREGPPGEAHAAQLRAILDDASRLHTIAREYLVSHGELSHLESDLKGLEPSGIDMDGPAAFVLQFTHPDDPDGLFRVEFKGGEPVSCGYDH